MSPEEWIASYRAYRLERRVARRLGVKQATPPWLSEKHRQEIKDTYLKAKKLGALGELYHVDHIVPLRGKAVCGLHVPWNLQILPAKINLQKGAKHVASPIREPL